MFVAAPGNIPAAVDTFAVVENYAVQFAVAAVVDVVAAPAVAVGSAAVAHSTVAPDISGTDVADGFVDVCLHPCKCGPLLWTGCRIAPLFSFQPHLCSPLGVPGV